MVHDEEDIRQAVLLILETEKGERVMRPEFGCALRWLMFRPLSTSTKALVQKAILDALVAWEPRINVESVVAREDPQRQGALLVDIRYAVRKTNTFYNLVFPFYLKEQR
jgi:phage baseplate assembly protein W